MYLEIFESCDTMYAMAVVNADGVNCAKPVNEGKRRFFERTRSR